MDDQKRMQIEAATFRRMVAHFQKRTDVQNIDLMGYGGFCRNCMYKWYREEAQGLGVHMEIEAAQQAIYGMAYKDFKAQYQTPASDEQLARMDKSVKLNGEMS
jgi:uncharacterized protein